MNNAKYSLLDPKVDYIFKQIFGQNTEICNRLLLNFLNSIFERVGSPKIKSIEYVNPYLDKEYSDDKQSILDIRVITNRNESIDIEMQVSSSPHYVKRSLWYWASLYEKQLEKSQSYGVLKKSIVVNLLNFNLPEFANLLDYHNVFEVKERRNNFKLTDDLEIHYIEFKKMKETTEISNLDTLSKWALFFKDANEVDKDMIIMKLREEVEEIDMAANILETVSQDQHERARYESRLKWILERNTFLYEADKANKLAEEYNKIAEEEKKRAETEKNRAEAEMKRADEEMKRAETEKNKADKILLASVAALKTTMCANDIASTLNMDIDVIEKILENLN